MLNYKFKKFESADEVCDFLNKAQNDYNLHIVVVQIVSYVYNGQILYFKIEDSETAEKFLEKF